MRGHIEVLKVSIKNTVGCSFFCSNGTEMLPFGSNYKNTPRAGTENRS